MVTLKFYEVKRQLVSVNVLLMNENRLLIEPNVKKIMIAAVLVGPPQQPYVVNHPKYLSHCAKLMGFFTWQVGISKSQIISANPSLI